VVQSVQLNWQDNSTAETKFEIWRSTNGSTFTWRAQVNANITSFTDSGLTSGQTYYYRVRAINATSSSAYSNIASATPSGSTSGVSGTLCVTMQCSIQPPWPSHNWRSRRSSMR